MLAALLLPLLSPQAARADNNWDAGNSELIVEITLAHNDGGYAAYFCAETLPGYAGNQAAADTHAQSADGNQNGAKGEVDVHFGRFYFKVGEPPQGYIISVRRYLWALCHALGGSSGTARGKALASLQILTPVQSTATTSGLLDKNSNNAVEQSDGKDSDTTVNTTINTDTLSQVYAGAYSEAFSSGTGGGEGATHCSIFWSNPGGE